MFLFLIATGCVQPFKKVSTNFQRPSEYDILLVTATVDAVSLRSPPPIMVQSGIETAVVNSVIQGVEASRIYPVLDEFSTESMREIKHLWQEENLLVHTDAMRVQRDISDERREMNRELDYAAGIWFDPEGTDYLRMDNDSFRSARRRARKIRAFDTPKENEAFLFSTLSIREQHTGFFRKEPVIILDTVIIDEKGRYLYRSRGIGYGESSRFALDYRKDSLKKGLSEALQSLNEVEVEPITNE